MLTDSAFFGWLLCELQNGVLYPLLEFHYHPSHKGVHAKMPCNTELDYTQRQLPQAPELNLKALPGLDPRTEDGRAICALFEVHEDAGGVRRIVTPLEYPGSHDQVVVRVRPRGNYWQLDENGEAAFYARMSGGEIESDNLQRWALDLEQNARVSFDDDEQLYAQVHDQRLIAPAIFQVAAAAQQLFALATAHKEREASDFKEKVAAIVSEVCASLNVPLQHNARLPISGDLEADHLLGLESSPLIIITATSAKRLLEAEVIHMQYQLSKQPGFVLAVAENQKAVGVRQFNRANYYTGKTVQFNPIDFAQLLRGALH